MVTIAAKSQVVGTNLEGIAHRDGSIYVCNAWNIDYTFNTNLVKLSAATLAKEKDITVVANPNQLIADGDKLFLASWGNYGDIPATIQRIDQNDQVTKLANATHMALGKNGLLYLISSIYDENWNLTNSYTVLNLATGEESLFTDGKEIYDPCTIGVDPISGFVFISSRKKYPDDEGNYTQDGYVACYTPLGDFIAKLDCGVNPGAMLFLSHTETRMVLK